MGDGEAVAAEAAVVGSDISCPCRPSILDGAAAGWRVVSEFMSSADSRQFRSSRKSKTVALARPGNEDGTAPRIEEQFPRSMTTKFERLDLRTRIGNETALPINRLQAEGICVVRSKG
jgi:hypothetical protein